MTNPLPQVDLQHTTAFATAASLASFTAPLQSAQAALLQGTGQGADFLGWLDLPQKIAPEQLAAMSQAAQQLRETSSVLLVVGIGGSYLGARAAIEYLQGPFANFLHSHQVFFVGNNLSPAYLQQVMQIVGARDYAINIVSKSGTTAEPAIAFQILKEQLEQRYGKEGARSRIVATTDPASGTLRALATAEGYTTFSIPPDVGGRYSLFTPCGLFPLYYAGIDAASVVAGAQAAAIALQQATTIESNPAWAYVAARHALLQTGRGIEFLGSYQPAAQMLGEWWKQLFGESEGKQGKGIFPATLQLTADLHSMGQYIQDGPRNLFSTILEVVQPGADVQLSVPQGEPLHYLNGWGMNAINAAVQQAAALAHVQGEAPTIIIKTPDFSPQAFGSLTYFFMYACALSGYLLGVNPFDQPGVEAYKTELRKLLQT